jgi:hypothetical protein
LLTFPFYSGDLSPSFCWIFPFAVVAGLLGFVGIFHSAVVVGLVSFGGFSVSAIVAGLLGFGGGLPGLF